MYNKARKESTINRSDDNVLKSQAFEEIVEFVERKRYENNVITMSSMTKMFEERLKVHGYEDCHAHTTRLRQNLTKTIPGLKDVETPNGWTLVFEENLSNAVTNYQGATKDDLSVLLKAVSILRKDILMQKQNFTGCYTTSSEKKSISKSLFCNSSS